MYQVRLTPVKTKKEILAESLVSASLGHSGFAHSERVAKLTATAHGERRGIEYLAALLHDVVEDSDVTLSTIENLFGSEVSTVVDALTRRDTETYAKYLERLSENKIAKSVKLFDLADHFDESATLSDSLSVRYAKATKYLSEWKDKPDQCQQQYTRGK